MTKLAGFLLVVTVAFTVWCLVEAAFADRRSVRRLPKPLWIVGIVLLPLVGGAAWLLSGRPVPAPARSTDTLGSDRATRNATNPAHEAVDLSTRIRERAEEQRRAYEQQQKKKNTEQPEPE